jgi:type II secretory pathway pseudopilin PulG
MLLLRLIMRRVSTVIKRLLTGKHKLVLAGFAVLVIALFSSGVWTVQTITERNNARRERQAALQESLAKEQAKLEEATAKNSHKAETENSQDEQEDEPDQEVIKYAISSDPRSTAYSTTPPKPNPKSFSTKITRNNQVAPGTMIFYNATKNEKGYYGGDLVVSPSTVTISSSAPDLVPITVSSPNGHVIGMPSLPWDDHSPYFWVVSSGTSIPDPALSYNLFIDSYNAPVGTHQLHITTGCGDSTQCDFFITVKVVE